MTPAIAPAGADRLPGSSTPRAAWRSPAALAGLGLVAAARLLTVPKGPWEYDEVLFVRGVERFAPLAYRPHPPGYPLLIGLGKVLAPIFGSPFRGLVALAVIASLVGYLASVEAFSRIGERRGHLRGAVPWAVLAALLFALSPPMLLYGPLALSDPVALAFVALALAAAAGPTERPATAAACGAFAAAAVGCRPQLALAVAPMLAAVVVLAAYRARRHDASRARAALPALALLLAAGVVALAWFLPLVAACEGPRGLYQLLTAQAGLVARNDATLARAGTSMAGVWARFVVDPWGPRWVAIGVLGSAVVGTALRLRTRRRAALPLLVFGAADLSLAVTAMNPADAARYALPSMLAVAFLAGRGWSALQGRRVGGLLALGLPLVLVTGSVLYTAPLLRQRTATESPPVQAAAWARGHLPPGTLVVYERELESHALELLPRWKRVAADGAMPCARGRAVFLLHEGEAGPGGASFRWAEGPAWRRLTRGHLGTVAWTPISGGQLFEPLLGVYGPEPSARAWLAGAPGADSWRWLADRAALRVCPQGATALELGLRLPANAPYEDLDVGVEAAGAAPVRVHLRHGESALLRLPLRETRRVRVELRADRSFVPAAAGIGPGDRRRLAVQLVRLRLLGPEEVP